MNETYRILAAFILLLVFPTTLLAEEVLYYHTDNFGTPMAMTDKTGKVVWRADELPFGEEYQTQEMPERNDRRFLGKQLDKETGLVYMGARYLDPRTGRFTQPDPVGLVDPATGKVNQQMLLNPQRLNRYVYGLNNPYRYVDQDGRAVRDFEHLRNPWRDMTEGGPPRSGSGYTGPKVRLRDFFRSRSGKVANGRAGKQARLGAIKDDMKASSSDRGWIKQEINQIKRGTRKNIRVPPGKNMAHKRGFEAKKGYDYKHSVLQDIDLHKLQHKHGGY